MVSGQPMPLSGDVSKPNWSKMIGFGKVFTEENRGCWIREFEGPQGAWAPTEPQVENEKKMDWKTEKKRSDQASKTEQKRKSEKRKKNVLGIFYMN